MPRHYGYATSPASPTCFFLTIRNGNPFATWATTSSSPIRPLTARSNRLHLQRGDPEGQSNDPQSAQLRLPKGRFGAERYCFALSKSLISVSNTSSVVGAGGASGAAACLRFRELINLTTRNIANATIRNWMTTLMKFP